MLRSEFLALATALAVAGGYCWLAPSSCCRAFRMHNPKNRIRLNTAATR